MAALKVLIECPICGNKHEMGYVPDIHGNTTADCPKCGGLLMIEDDYSITNFGAKLRKDYEEYVNKKEVE